MDIIPYLTKKQLLYFFNPCSCGYYLTCEIQPEYKIIQSLFVWILYHALAIWQDRIPSVSWNKPNSLLVDRNYEGLKSKPEWGINLSKKNLELLEKFGFYRIVQTL